MTRVLAQLGSMPNRFMRYFIVVLFLTAFICSCVSVHTQEANSQSINKTVIDKNRLVVLIDDHLQLYEQVITGIHVESQGNYQVLKLQEEGFVQSAFLEQLIALKPGALIALGPRSANAIAQTHVILPSAFSMVPRIENYELNNVFIAGIRMIPDAKKRVGLVHALMPNLKALGVVFSRQNSRNAMQKLRSLCDDEPFELIDIEVQTTGDVLPAIMRYHREVSSILMLDDPLLLDVEVLRAMTTYLSENNIAFFALDCAMVQAGALAAFGTNFFTIGKDLVQMVARDRKPHQYLPTFFINPSEADICLNRKIAKNLDDKDQILINAINYASDSKSMLRVF